MGGNWQSTRHSGFDFLRSGRRVGALLCRLVGRLFRFIQSQALGLLGADFDLTENRPYRVARAVFGQQFRDHSRAGRGDRHHGLVCLDLDEIGISLDAVTFFEEEANDGRLGDRFAELGHFNGNESHGGSEMKEAPGCGGNGGCCGAVCRPKVGMIGNWRVFGVDPHGCGVKQAEAFGGDTGENFGCDTAPGPLFADAEQAAGAGH